MQIIRVKTIALCCLLGILSLSAVQKSHGQENNIHALRGAYLYYFAHFIQWPKDTPFLDEHFNLCALTTNSDAIFQLRTLNNKELADTRLNIILSDDSSAQAKNSFSNCHMLYVAQPQYEYFSNSHFQIADYTLVVTEEINQAVSPLKLYRDGNKLRFEINNSVLAKANFKASSKLLRLSKRKHSDD